MADPIERLQAILESAFAPLAADETPKAKLAECEAGLAAEMTKLDGCGPDVHARLHAMQLDMKARVALLPPEVSQRHDEWLRIRRLQFRSVRGPDGRPRFPDIPRGVLSVPHETLRAFIDARVELRYRQHRLQHPSACDCDAITSLKIARKPESPSLVSRGPMYRNFGDGEAFECTACGAEWFEGSTPDDRGWPFWERIDRGAKPTD